MSNSQLEFGFEASPETPPIDASLTTPRVGDAPKEARNYLDTLKELAKQFRRVHPAFAAEQSREDRMQAAIAKGSGYEVQLTINDNRSTLMSVKYAPFGRKLARVSLHRMFLDADNQIVAAVAHWVKHPRSKQNTALLNAFIRQSNDALPPRRPRAVRVNTSGKVHDLRRLYDEVNAAHFENRVDVPITWGKMPSKPTRRSIRFGSYSPTDHLVRMHPLLDDPAVPEFLVRYIVFHEMLHADLGIEETEGRRVIHSREFRARERAYPDFARADAWISEPANLRALLGRARHKAHR